jgi:large subunit ribosomal protein L41
MAWRNSILSLASRAPPKLSCIISSAARYQSTTIAVNSNNLVARTNNYYSSLLNNSSTSLFQESRRFMSKYLSKSATKRLPLTNKKAKKGYYKGNGATMEGRITSKGKFIADPTKKLQLVIPDLEGFKLKPYIASAVSKLPPEQRTHDMMPGN